MRVLFVTHTVVMAGANSSMLILMKELREKYAVDTAVLMPNVHYAYKGRNLYKVCKDEQIECYSYRFYWFKNQRNWKRYLEFVSNLLWYPRILWKMRGKQFDIIHSNGSVISLGALISRVKRTPHVWHLREFGDLDFNLHPLIGSRYEKWIYSKADSYIAISETIRRYFSNKIDSNKIKVIYNGVAPAKRIASHNNSKIQICMVGLVCEGKNQMEALRAIDNLVNIHRITNFHLSFIGLEVQPYAKSLRSYIKDHVLESYVTFNGEKNDVGLLLQGMDVGLMLSKNEAFGRVTVEYMMHGLAVIASHSGANREIIADNETGYIYQLGDAEALALCMEKLIDNHDKLLSLAEKGKNRALELFTPERYAEAVNEVYRSLAE